MSNNSSLEQSYREAWQAYLSTSSQTKGLGASPPALTCYDRRGQVTRASLAKATARCRRAIDDLQLKLSRKIFTLEFMTDVLEGRVDVEGLATRSQESSDDWSDDSDVASSASRENQSTNESRLKNNSRLASSVLAGNLNAPIRSELCENNSHEFTDKDVTQAENLDVRTNDYQLGASEVVDTTPMRQGFQVRKEPLSRTASEPKSIVVRRTKTNELQRKQQTFSLRSSSSSEQANYRRTLKNLVNLDEDDDVAACSIEDESKNLGDCDTDISKTSVNQSNFDISNNSLSKWSDGLPTVGFKSTLADKLRNNDERKENSDSGDIAKILRVNSVTSSDRSTVVKAKPLAPTPSSKSSVISSPKIAVRTESIDNPSIPAQEPPLSSDSVLRRKTSPLKSKTSTSSAKDAPSKAIDPHITTSGSSQNAVPAGPTDTLVPGKNAASKHTLGTESASKDNNDDQESSEDDEDNLITLRESVRLSSQWCADVDSSRQRLSQQAVRLSNRFSRCYGDANHGNSLTLETKTRTTQGALDVLIEAPSTMNLSSIEESDFTTVEGGLEYLLPPPTPATLSIDCLTHHSLSSGIVNNNNNGTCIGLVNNNNNVISEISPPNSIVFSSANSTPYSSKLEMRRIVISSLLKSDRAYLKILHCLLEYKQSFKTLVEGASMTQRGGVTLDDLDVMFKGIDDLHKIHDQFINDLQPLLNNPLADPCMAEIFKIMALQEYNVAADYLRNYQNAVTTVKNCRQASPQFNEITQNMVCPGLGERTNLEEMLHQPIIRFQRSTLVLHDLIKYTPTGHADYDLLQKTQKFAANFLESFGRLDEQASVNSGIESERLHERFLAREGLLVEKMARCRKLRHLFLYNDVLACAKVKHSNRQKAQYELKWFVPLIDLSLEDKLISQDNGGALGRLDGDNSQQMQHSAEVEAIHRKVIALQKEYKQELKKYKAAAEQSKGKLRSPVTNKNVEKTKKKLMEQEAALFVAQPHLEFCVHNRRSQRQHLLMMSSDYERTDWRDTIAGLLSKLDPDALLPTAIEIQNLINKHQKLSIRSNLPFERDSEEEKLFGSLHVKVCRLMCLSRPANAFCNVEIDSFGLFTVKARTRVIERSTEPNWNADFELDLEGAQTIRFLCYDRQARKPEATPADKNSSCVVAEPILLGRGALELRSVWLKEESHTYTVVLSNNLSLVVVLEYFSREQTMSKYQTLERKTGVFGVPIAELTRREGGAVPLIISSCVQQIEKRGLDEEGLYRISGMSTTIDQLKDSFDKNVRQAMQKVKTTSVDVLTGLIKLYLRTLPDSLYTDNMYNSFVEAIGLADPDAKDSCLITLLASVPEPNLSTIMFLLDHLVKVSKHEPTNRMTLRNLATVFGPTLLRPISSRQSQPTLSMEQLIFLSTHQAVQQSSILFHYLNLRATAPHLFTAKISYCSSI